MKIKELIFGKDADIKEVRQYSGSTQKLLPIADIRDGVVVTKDGRVVKILEVLPVNFTLKSPIERQNIIYYYASYLKIAPDNLQICSITQKADIEGYVRRMWEYHESELVQGCRDMIEDNINEVSYLATNEAVTRRFFLMFQYESSMKGRGNDIKALAERLSEEAKTAMRYLSMCGLEVLSPEFSDNFHLQTLYSLINKRSSVHNRLPDDVFRSCTDFVGGINLEDWSDEIEQERL